MSETNPNPSGDSPSSLAVERRAWVRYGSDLTVACQTTGGLRDVGWIARVRDISAGGIGLLLRHRFRPGTPLLIELRTARGQFRRTVAARVVHATAVVVDGVSSWLLGCAFAEPLGDQEMEALR
jgi:hypothetical protein